MAKVPRIIGNAAEPDQANHTCIICGKPLTGRFAWLELDQRTNTYHDFGGVPEDKSQGWFPVGMACARKCLNKSCECLAA